MRRNGWHMVWDEDGALIHARRLPARFDLAAEVVLPGDGRPTRLLRQVRQDVWRALRHLRGFSPAVRAERTGDGWRVTAGGALTGAASARDRARLAAVLEDAGNRARWIRWAA